MKERTKRKKKWKYKVYEVGGGKEEKKEQKRRRQRSKGSWKLGRPEIST
jgi:hypothetical protein